MGGDELALIIIFGSVVSIVFLGIVGSIIKAWVKRGSTTSLAENQEFLSALREFKERTDKRLSNLEAIVAEEHPSKAPEKASRKKISDKKEQKSAIEIEIEENEEMKESEKQSGKLRNMLNQ